MSIAGCFEDTRNTSAAENCRSPGLLKPFRCLYATDQHIEMISQFHNLTSLVLLNPQPAASLRSLSHRKVLKNFTLIESKFSGVQDVLTSLGNQLICLCLTDVLITDFYFVIRNCRSLECIYLYFSFSYHLLLSGNTVTRESGSVPVLGFPHVVALEVFRTALSTMQYILNCFQNMKLSYHLQMTVYYILYVQVTMHRDKLRIKQPTRCVKYPKFILS